MSYPPAKIARFEGSDDSGESQSGEERKEEEIETGFASTSAQNARPDEVTDGAIGVAGSSRQNGRAGGSTGYVKSEKPVREP